MARVFISYRRGDTRWAAGRIYDRLVEKLGGENVILDVTDIEPGEDFSSRIQQFVNRCDVLLAVIGPTWLTSVDRAGGRRLDDPRDLVRIEIATALQRNIRVIPVLLDETSMPREDELPEVLAPLARRNAREVSYSRFHSDLDSFIRVLERVLAIPSRPVETAATSTPARYTELPFSISIETVGGVATPLLKRGAVLPAAFAETFSTAEDNQSAVTVQLFAGEQPMAAQNVAIGRFEFDSIAPARKGVPQLNLQANVDPALVLTVAFKDEATGRVQVLDAIDLTRVELGSGANDAPAQPASARDSRFDLSTGRAASGDRAFNGLFGEVFGDILGRGKPPPALDVTMEVAVPPSQLGAERTIRLGDGRQIKVMIPSTIKDGQALRLRGMGTQAGETTGDLYLKIRISD